MAKPECSEHLDGFQHLSEDLAGLEDFHLGEKWQDADLMQPSAIQEKMYCVSYRKKGLPPEADRRLCYYRTRSFFTPDDAKDMKRKALRQLVADVKAQSTGKLPV